MTVIAILSVDFPLIFPRRHCKTESFGVSLMDAGVGSFIFSHAITSPTARQASSSTSSTAASADEKGGAGSGRCGVLVAVFRNVLPLIVLGCSRLFAIQSTDYHVHTSEYGVHWNFFFTLAGVALASTVLEPLLPVGSFGIAGFIILTAYQLALSPIGGLEHWILTADRTQSWIAANKEGLTSLVGYFALYLIAVQIGRCGIL